MEELYAFLWSFLLALLAKKDHRKRNLPLCRRRKALFAYVLLMNECGQHLRTWWCMPGAAARRTLHSLGSGGCCDILEQWMM